MNINDKILVTGAGGLVGSALVDHLKLKGYSNVVGIRRDDCDLIETKKVFDLFERLQPSHVFHAAARVYGIMGNMKNQGLSFYENCLINTNVVEAARRCRAKKITVMGTGAIYPFPSPGLPLKESMIYHGKPHHAESAYANAKRAMLAMLEAYQESYDLQWAYIVSCNLFGPRDKFDTINGHVVPSLIKKFYDAKAAGTKVNVWGDGSARRDFMYVKDMARAAQMIMESHNGPINLGSGNILSIKDIVDSLGAITGMNDRIEWDPAMPNGQDYRAYDLTHLNNINFKCKYSIKGGLQETWNWYAENPN